MYSVLREADEHFQSWSYWDTASGGALWDGEGKPVLDAVRVFSRPFPPATAGTPVKLEFGNDDTAILNYKFC